MKTTSIIGILFAAAIPGGGLLPPASAEDSAWSGSCTVRFEGKSTLHDFSGTAKAEPFILRVSGIDDPARAKATARVVVKEAGMDTGNKKRDAEMHHCLEGAKHPEIVVELNDLPIASTKPADGGTLPRPTVIPFSLLLKGRTHQVTGQVSNWSFDGTKVDCTVAFPVSLNAAGIEPPSVLGLVKVRDEIRVSARLHLERKGS